MLCYSRLKPLDTYLVCIVASPAWDLTNLCSAPTNDADSLVIRTELQTVSLRILP